MSDVYLEVPMTTDASVLADEAIEALQAVWPDWEPNDGDLEVVMIEVISAMAADAARTAAQVPSAIFNAFGQAFAGITRNEGTYAQASFIVNLTSFGPLTIPAGSEFDVDGYAWVVDEDVSASASEQQVEIFVTAAEVGTAPNIDGLPNAVSPISALAFIEDVEADSIDNYSAGTDPETDEEYLDRLSTVMELQSTTLVTTNDFEVLALNGPIAGVGRAVAIHVAARHVDFYGIDEEGDDLSAPLKTELAELFESLRMVNTTVDMEDPDRTTVSVTYEVALYVGYDEDALIAEIDAVLEELLAPLTWGTPTSPLPSIPDVGRARWVNEPTVRRNKLIDKIGNVAGVDYVNSVTITGGAGAVTGVAATNLLTRVGHGYAADDQVVFLSKTGGTGITVGQRYYVIAGGLTADAFKVSDTQGGAEEDFTTDLTAGQIARIGDVDTGDLEMPGDVPLPEPGTMTGTVV